jgi:hypothetical protein
MRKELAPASTRTLRPPARSAWVTVSAMFERYSSTVFIILAIVLGTNAIFFLFASTERANPGDLPTTTAGKNLIYVSIWLGLWAWAAMYQGWTGH